MRPQQSVMDFDLFDMAGFTRPTVEDWQASERKAARERADQERKAADERARRERFDRESRERREQHQRERQARSGRAAPESPWDVLGVVPGAGKADIRSAWVRACKRHHPDAGGSEEAMKRVNRAYNALKGQMR